MLGDAEPIKEAKKAIKKIKNNNNYVFININKKAHQ